MTNKLLAMLIEEKIKPIRELDRKWYSDKKRFSEWSIIRDVGNAFLDIAEELKSEE